MKNCKKIEDDENSFEKTEQIFASKGREVVRRGMLLILERLRFAKKYDTKIREAICAIDDNDELKAAQAKALIEALRRANVMDTSEILSLVTEVINRLGDGGESEKEQCDEVVVTLDERVKKWAQ